MSIEHNEVAKIAHLARIAITDTEISEYASDLNNILDLVATMETADTTAIAPLSDPLEREQRLREDKVTETNQREKLLKLAPQTEAGLFLVPQVIE